MTNTITTTRLGKALYWGSTGLGALLLTAIGLSDLTHEQHIVEGLKHLGYPAYLATILGAWKVAAAVALVAPGLRRLKEWAYAGVFFALTGAAASHIASGDPASGFMGPLVILGIVMTSWALQDARAPRS